MANKSQKPAPRFPIGMQSPAQMTQEQKESAALRSFLQHREALAQGILYNALHSGASILLNEDDTPNYKPAVMAAIEAADLMLNELYGKQFVPAPAPEKEGKEGEK